MHEPLRLKSENNRENSAFGVGSELFARFLGKSNRNTTTQHPWRPKETEQRCLPTNIDH